MEEKRHELLKWMIDDKMLKHFDLNALPPKYFLDVLSLVLLKSVGEIDIAEADIFLCSLMQLDDAKHLEYPRNIDQRAFRLTFLFHKVREMVKKSLEIVGLKKHAVEFMLLRTKLFYLPAFFISDIAPI